MCFPDSAAIELANGVPIAALGVWAGETIQNRSACSRSRRRRTDLVALRLVFERDFFFMTGGLHVAGQ
jgi:hypothetical protein